MTPIETVERFWALMASNDFNSVAQVLADDFVLDWPQSNERIRGRENFVRMNAEYPAHGLWQFRINTLFADGAQVVSDVAITDGVQRARAISFFRVEADKIKSVIEFWPEPYAAPANRSHLVETIAVG